THSGAFWISGALWAFGFWVADIRTRNPESERPEGMRNPRSKRPEGARNPKFKIQNPKWRLGLAGPVRRLRVQSRGRAGDPRRQRAGPVGQQPQRPASPATGYGGLRRPKRVRRVLGGEAGDRRAAALERQRELPPPRTRHP